jgi:hypothetical protein
MKKKLSHGLGVTALTFAWLCLTAWVLIAAQPFSHTSEEPPPEKTLWDRLSDRASLLRRHDPDSPLEDIRLAAQRMGVVDWHAAAQRGQGVKIAVLDSGFKGYQGALGTVLPASVKVKSFRKDGRLEARDSQHGILCGEVIHHLAPEAEILLANWEPENPEQFLEAVRWARREGAKVISCSIIMPTWSDGEGGGTVHKELLALLGDGSKKGDGLLFASAGNTALRHWSGLYAPARDGWHQWVKGRKENTIRPLSSDRLSVELCGPGDASYEMVVRDMTADRDVDMVRTSTRDNCLSAALRFLPREGHRYSVRVRQLHAEAHKGKEPGRFHLTVLGGKLGHASKAGSIPFPGDGRAAVAVAAVDAKGRRLSYSSCGPNGRCPKPELSAVVPFASVWRPEQAFSGTSAAAPQAAALAVLLWARYPALTANEVRHLLEKSAVPMSKGHCCETGHGVLRLPR